MNNDMTRTTKTGAITSPSPTTQQSGTPREILGITDEEFLAMGQIGAMYYEQGVLDKAQMIFEGLVEIDSQSSDAHAALGALYTRTEQNEKALAHLNRAIELEEDQIAPHVNRAEVCIRLEQIEQAVADLERAIELDPEETDPAAIRARAMVLGIQEALQEECIM